MWDWLSNLFGGATDVASGASDVATPAISDASDVALGIPSLGADAANVASAFGGAADLGTANPATFASAAAPAAEAATGTVGGVPEVGQGASQPGANFGGFEQPEAPPGPGQPGAIGVPQHAPPPTAWESVKNAPGKWWQGASNEFSANPISTTLKTGILASPFIAAGMAPSTPQPGKYTMHPPATPPSTPPNTPIPAGSPMSPVLTGTGGFQVGGQQQQKPAPGMAEGGMVAAPGLANGGQIPNYIKALTLHLQ